MTLPHGLYISITTTKENKTKQESSERTFTVWIQLVSLTIQAQYKREQFGQI